MILWESNLGIHPDFQIITANPTHVFGYDNADFAFIYQRHHALPIRPLEVRAGVAVIHKILNIPKSFFPCKPGEEGFLVHNGVAVPLLVIIAGEAAVKRCDFVRLFHRVSLHIRWAVCQNRVAAVHGFTHLFVRPSASPSFREVCVSRQSCR